MKREKEKEIKVKYKDIYYTKVKKLLKKLLLIILNKLLLIIKQDIKKVFDIKINNENNKYEALLKKIETVKEEWKKEIESIKLQHEKKKEGLYEFYKQKINDKINEINYVSLVF